MMVKYLILIVTKYVLGREQSDKIKIGLDG